jgi:hypothetical protein
VPRSAMDVHTTLREWWVAGSWCWGPKRRALRAFELIRQAAAAAGSAAAGKAGSIRDGEAFCAHGNRLRCLGTPGCSDHMGNAWRGPGVQVRVLINLPNSRMRMSMTGVPSLRI